jgi:hypothetical protein
MITEQQYKELEKEMALVHADMKIEDERIAALNAAAIEFVKANINYDFDLIDLDGINWKHEGYVEVEKSDFKNGFYPNHEFYKVKDENLNYMKQDEDGEFHNMVWQTTGACEDDYSGFQLFPLSNGKYWKISYYC